MPEEEPVIKIVFISFLFPFLSELMFWDEFIMTSKKGIDNGQYGTEWDLCHTYIKRVAKK